MLTGSCMCGKVQYAIQGKPRYMYQCHCARCRTASGAAFVTNLIVDADRFDLTAGKDSLARYESSPRKFRHFCGNCGSPVYSWSENTRHIVSVRSGTLKQDPGLKPAYHAFAADKAPWVELKDGLPCFDEWADMALVRRLYEGS